MCHSNSNFQHKFKQTLGKYLLNLKIGYEYAFYAFCYMYLPFLAIPI